MLCTLRFDELPRNHAKTRLIGPYPNFFGQPVDAGVYESDPVAVRPKPTRKGWRYKAAVNDKPNIKSIKSA
jgi:hypothetical protein